MNSVILSKTYKQFPFCEKEILRYAGCKSADSATYTLLQSCINELDGKITYNVCYREFPLNLNGDICDFGNFSLKSKNLVLNLNGCTNAIVFAATVGIGIDRLIAKYGRISPSRALMFQAIGAERIEALCDAFCSDIENEYFTCTKPRFSPGYGDLPLSTQREIFNILTPEKRIGLTLNESFLMSPSKSVTAVVGIGGERKNVKNKCCDCNLKDCAYRGAL